MTDVKTGNPFYDMIMADYVGAKETQANRPIQTSQKSKPLEYNDMLKRRNQIGAERAALANALKQRENFGYGFANALSQMPAQQGYGSWLGDFARGFGLAYNARTNSEISRAEQDYERAQRDLADALMYNKAMGEEQIIGYTPFATGTKSQTKTKDNNDVAKKMVVRENAAATIGDLYKTIDANPQAFSATGGIKQDEVSKGLKSGVDVMGISALGKQEFMYLSDLMPNGFASTINQVKEQEVMRPHTTKFRDGRGSEKKATIKAMLSDIYDAFEQDVASQGFKMPISKAEYIDNRIKEGREINAKWFTDTTTPMYKDSDEGNKAVPTTSDNWKKFMAGTK